MGRRRPFTLDEFAGHPLVLAFVPRFDPVEAARAQPRGKGAALLVVAPRGAWCQRTGKALERHAGASDRTAALRARFGVAARATAAVLVLDDALAVRFRYVADAEPEAEATFAVVAMALDVAGRALVAGSSPRWLPSSRELPARARAAAG